MKISKFFIFLTSFNFACRCNGLCGLESFFESAKVFDKTLAGYTLETRNVFSLLECADSCMRNSECRSFNFQRDSIEEGKICKLNHVRQTEVDSDEISSKTGIDFYDFGAHEIKQILLGRKKDSNGSCSTTRKEKRTVFSKCRTALEDDPSLPTGLYWIDPDGGSHDNAFQVYCDMETAGGGWTLVWSYTFTNYHQFDSNSNAVTSVPTWNVAGSNNVEISRKVPLGETDYGAIDFPKWKNIRVEVLIKSNINSWISCEPISGNVVLYVEGEITCTVLKEVTEKCKGYDAPNAFSETNYGPHSGDLKRTTTSLKEEKLIFSQFTTHADVEKLDKRTEFPIHMVTFSYADMKIALALREC